MICERCGKETPDHPYGELKKYCSEKCRHAEEMRRYRERYPEKFPKHLRIKKIKYYCYKKSALFPMPLPRKICVFCGKEFEYKRSNKKYCSPECSYEYGITHISEETRKKNAERGKRSRFKNGYKHSQEVRKSDPLFSKKCKARYAIESAVKKGEIIKPKNCQNCGEEKFLEGHHYKGYDFIYDVRWLCHRCHAKEDRKNINHSPAPVILDKI